MKSVLDAINIRHFPQLPPETWAKLRSELGREPLRFGQWFWPSPGDWPEALRYAMSRDREIPIDQFDTPKFATEMAQIQQWCTNVLIPRVRQCSLEIELAQQGYRAVIEDEAGAILLAGLARTSRDELLVWLPLAARMLTLYNAIRGPRALDILFPYLVTLPEGENLAYANIVVHDRLCILARIPRDFPDTAYMHFYVRGMQAEHHPVSVTGVAYWLDETLPIDDYVGILHAMRKIDKILYYKEVNDERV